MVSAWSFCFDHDIIDIIPFAKVGHDVYDERIT